jgi:hypothetical protein
MKTFIITVCIILGVFFLLLNFAPTWETPNVESAGVSSLRNRVTIERAGGHQYATMSSITGVGGITHHEGCDNPIHN